MLPKAKDIVRGQTHSALAELRSDLYGLTSTPGWTLIEHHLEKRRVELRKRIEQPIALDSTSGLQRHNANVTELQLISELLGWSSAVIEECGRILEGEADG